MAHQVHIDRKELTHDPLRDAFFDTVAYVYERRIAFIIGGVAALLLVAAGAGTYGYTQYTERVDSEAYLHADRLLNDRLLPVDQRLKQGGDAFRVFVEQRPRSTLAPAAWLTLARLAWDQKQWDQATAAFQHAVDSGQATPILRTEGLLGLGKIKEEQGKPSEAQAYFDKIGDDFADVKQLALGRAALAAGDPKGAREHFLQAAAAGANSMISVQAREELEALPQ